MRHRVLIVEDEPKLQKRLSERIASEGFSVFTCSSFLELQSILMLPTRRFDVMILDRLLNGKDSATLIPRIKKEMPDTKILVVSAINTAGEKAAVLDIGADDYLSKPCDSEELIARIRVLLRRNAPELKLGDLVLDFAERSLRVKDQSVSLTNMEFLLLRTLLQAPGKVLSKDFIYEKVWELKTDVDSNVVEVTVNKIRRRLQDAGAAVTIKNTRNVGYWIEE